MADSTTNLDQIPESSSQKGAIANALFDAGSSALVFGRRSSACAALTWGYYGGVLPVAGVPTTIANGTLTLAASATNYVEATTAGVVSSNTSAFTGGRLQLYTVVTGASTVTSYTDKRFAGMWLAAGSGDMVLASVQVVTALKTFGAAGAVSKFALAGNTSGSTVLDASAVASGTATLPAGTYTVGYLDIPQNSQSSAYTTVMGDRGKHIFHPAADTTARVWTIDSNANVPYPVGTALTFINEHGAGVITIVITADTMRLAGTGTTGSRTFVADGMATAVKIGTTTWIISGSGLT